VKRLDKDLIEQAPHVAWRDFTGFRNMLIHQYRSDQAGLGVEFRTGELKAAVTALLKNLETGDDAAKG